MKEDIVKPNFRSYYNYFCTIVNYNYSNDYSKVLFNLVIFSEVIQYIQQQFSRL